MIVARPTSWSEPRIDARAPPPTPAAFGAFVSRSRLSAPMPLTTTKPMTAKSGTIATIAATPHRARKNRSTADRRRSVRDLTRVRGSALLATAISATRRHADAVTGDPADQDPGDDVQHDRHHEECQTERDQARRLETDG